MVWYSATLETYIKEKKQWRVVQLNTNKTPPVAVYAEALNDILG